MNAISLQSLQGPARWAVPFLAALGLSILVGQINHYLAPLRVYLYAGGLYIAFSSLRLNFRRGLVVAMLAGLAIDAVEPVPFGTHLVLLSAAHAVIYHVRTRFPREEIIFGVLVALLANLGLFLALSLFLINQQPAPGAAWLRLLADLFFSQVFVAGITPWFFALQQEALNLVQIDPASD